MKVHLAEDRRWYLISNDGHLLAGPFEHQTEAILAQDGMAAENGPEEFCKDAMR